MTDPTQAAPVGDLREEILDHLTDALPLKQATVLLNDLLVPDGPIGKLQAEHQREKERGHRYRDKMAARIAALEAELEALTIK
jgi:hypothetical protein